MKKYLAPLAFVITAILPYSILIALLISPLIPNFDNLDLMLWIFLGFCGVVLILNIAVVCIHKDLDPKKMAKAYMIMKLVQIPAYILNFGTGYASAVMIVTLAVTVGIIILDYIVEILGVVLMIATMKSAKDHGLLSKGERIMHIIIQFFYCIDIISAIVAFVRIKETAPVEGPAAQPIAEAPQQSTADQASIQG